MKGAPLRWLAAILLVPLVLLPGLWPLVWALGDHEISWRLADDSKRLATLLGITATLLAGIGLISIPLGTMIGITLVRLAPWWRAATAVVLFSTAVAPVALVSCGWLATIGPHGLIDPKSLGFDGPIRGGWLGLAAATLLHAVVGIGWVTVGVVAAVYSSDRREEEAILLEGSPFQALWLGTLPAARWGIALGGWLAAVSVLTEMAICDLFAQRSFAEEVFTQIELGSGDRATALLTLPITLLASVGLSFALRGLLHSNAGMPAETAWQSVGATRSPTAIFLKALTLITTLIVAAPIIGFLHQVGLESTFDTPEAGTRWSATVAAVYLRRLMESDGWVMLQSLAVSAAAAMGATLAASVLSWTWLRSSRWNQIAGLGLAAWMSALPGPVLGLSLVDILNRPEPTGVLVALYDSPAVVALGQAIRVLPWVFLIQSAGLRRVRPAAWELLQLEGASEWMTYRLIAWGENGRVIGLSFLVGWAWCLGELGTTKILAPPGFEPWSARIFSILHVGSGNDLAASGLIMTGLVMAISALIGCLALKSLDASHGYGSSVK